MHIAASKGHTEVVKLLLEHGANIDYQNKEGRTALHMAASNGRTEVVKLLLHGGANIDYQSKEGRTALHMAASNGRTEVVECLLEHKANSNTKDKENKTPLESAVRHGHAAIIESLFKHGAEDNKEFLLSTAIRNNNDKATEVLLKNYANPNKSCIIDEIPNIPKKFLSQGIEQTYTIKQTSLLYYVINTRKCETQLSIADKAENDKKAAIIDMLLHYRADINLKGQDSLFLAVNNEDYQVLDLLLKYNAKITTFNPNIILQYFNAKVAVTKGYYALTKFLLEKEKENTSDDIFAKTIYSLLDLAVSHGQKEIVSLLLNNKIDSTNITTALKKASEKGHIEIQNILLSYSETGNNHDDTQNICTNTNDVGCLGKNTELDLMSFDS